MESLALMSGVFLALAWYNMLAVFVITIIFVLCVFNEVTEGAAIFLGALVFVLHYLGVVQLSLDWSTVIYSLIGYFAIGCIWSLFKYKNEAERLAKHCLKEYPIQSREETLKDIKIIITNSMISFWIVFFPISMLKFALSDFVDYIISKLGRVYDSIAKYVVGSIYKDEIVKSKTTSEFRENRE